MPAKTLGEIAKSIGAVCSGDEKTLISGVATIETAGSGDITFVSNPAYGKHLATTQASAVVLDLETECSHLPVLRHADPYLTFARIVDLFNPPKKYLPSGVDASAKVDPSASLHAEAAIGPFCSIGPNSTVGQGTQLLSHIGLGTNVTIGDNCLIYPGVQILDGSRIGNNVIIHAGTVIGSDGFGFAQTETGLRKIQQVGCVEIGNDVELGSNCSVDRGAIGPTKIGDGTKIDNLVQIAHNVQIGRHCIVVAQVGISGSTQIGNGVILAGQAGIVGHLKIEDGAVVAAQSGVMRSIPAGQTVLGSPARPASESKRIEVSLGRLPDLFKRVRKLEKNQSND